MAKENNNNLRNQMNNVNNKQRLECAEELNNKDFCNDKENNKEKQDR